MNGHAASTSGNDRQQSVFRLGTVALLVAGAALLPLQRAAAAEALVFRTVALTGDPAPGATDGAHFSFFTTAISHTIMSPRIDDAGSVAFIAFVAGGSVGPGSQSGIWSEGGGALDEIVRTGMQAPGLAPGVVFSGVPDEELPFPPAYAAGQVAFNGALMGEGIDFTQDQGVWVQQETGLVLAAREGTQVQGLPDGAVFSSVSLEGLDASGVAHLSGVFHGTGVTGGNNEGVLQYRDGALALVLREGDPAPGLPGGVLIGRGESGITHVFSRVAFNAASRLAVSLLLKGAGVNGSNDEVLLLQSGPGGALLPLVREGDPVPGFSPGVTFGGNSDQLGIRDQVLNDAGQVAFSAQIGGAVSTRTVIFSTASGTLAPVAAPDEPAPGTGEEFTFVLGPLLNQTGGVAFVGGLPGDLFNPPQGIWHSRDGNLTAVFLQGDVALRGEQVLTIERVTRIAGFNSADDIIAEVMVADGDGVPRSAYLMSSPSGIPVVLVVAGEHFDVRGDGSELREVSRLVAGGLSDSGDFAFRLDFTDGSSGHFTVARDRDGDGIADMRDNCMFVSNEDQRDSDGDGFGNLCDADLNNDGVVNFEDLALLKSVFFTADANADFDGDGHVNFQDLAIMRAAFFGAPGSP